jgi:hypothetical protein
MRHVARASGDGGRRPATRVTFRRRSSSRPETLAGWATPARLRIGCEWGAEALCDAPGGNGLRTKPTSPIGASRCCGRAATVTRPVRRQLTARPSGFRDRPAFA